MDPVDDSVIAVLHARLIRFDVQEQLSHHHDAELPNLRRRYQVLQHRKSDLANLLVNGTLTSSEVKTAADSLASQMSDIDQKISAAISPVAAAISEPELAAGLRTLTLDRQRALVQSIMTVTLHRGIRGSRRFCPESVSISWKS